MKKIFKYLYIFIIILFQIGCHPDKSNSFQTQREQNKINNPISNSNKNKTIENKINTRGYSSGIIKQHQKYVKEENNFPYLVQLLILNNKKIIVFNKPNGKIIDTLKNDTLNENYYIISILKKKNNWLKFVAEGIQDTLYGWTKDIESFGVYMRNYDDTLFVYKQPIIRSEAFCKISNYYPEMVPIIDFKKSWLKISLKTKNTYCIGWIPDTMACANPYTTCN